MTATNVFEYLWSEYQPMIDTLSYKFGSQYHHLGASTDDFRQEAVAWMLDKEDKLATKLAGFEGDDDAFGKWLYRVLENEFRDYAVDIKDQAGLQPRAGIFFYSPADLRTLLPSMFDRDAWLHPPQSDDGTQGRSSKALDEGNNWVTTLADVSRAFEALDPKDQGLIRRFHQWGETNADLAEEYGISHQSMSNKHTRVLNKMVEFLGGPRPQPMRPDQENDPWRGRHSISTARARAIQQSYYEES